MGQRPRIEHCVARSEDVLKRCMDGQRKPRAPAFYQDKVSKLTAVAHGNGFENLREVLCVFIMEGVREIHHQVPESMMLIVLGDSCTSF